MKINEVMAEASVDRKQFGKETVRANQKANIARSAAFRAQMDAKPEEPAAATPAAAPAAAATPSGPPILCALIVAAVTSSAAKLNSTLPKL